MSHFTEMIKEQLEKLRKAVDTKEFVNGKYSMGLELDVQLDHINTISLLLEVIGSDQGNRYSFDELPTGTISGISFLLQHHIELAKNLSVAIQGSISNGGEK